MKVLQINSFFSIGGPPKIVNGIYDALKINGDKCLIAAVRGEIQHPGDSYQVGNRYSAYVNAIKTRVLDNEGFNARRATEKLVARAKEFSPDVIHVHNLHGYALNIEVLFDYLKTAGVPVVFTLHDCWTMTGHCPHFDAIGCDKWKNGGCHNCPQKKVYPSSLALDRSKRNYVKKKEVFSGVPDMTIVTVSDWLKGIVKESYLKDYDVRVIPNGIDLSVFRPVHGRLREMIPGNKKIVLGVAQNWCENKGFYDMFRLADALGDGYKVVMVGIADKLMREVPDNVLAFGRTENAEELAKFYSDADIFVNFSVEESMGMTTVEALACGTPAIVYDRTAVPEVVDESCGFVVPAHDIEKAAETIREIIDKKPEMTENCVKRAEKYEKNAQYGKYVELYRELLGEARK